MIDYKSTELNKPQIHWLIRNTTQGEVAMISAEDKISSILIKYPQLKQKLIERSPKFQNLKNPIILKTVGQFATVADAARNTGEDLEEFLRFLNQNT